MRARRRVSTKLLRVSVHVAADEAEPARARLLSLVPEGFEEVDEGDALELAAYVDEAAAARLLALFPTARTTVVEPGWEEGWRRFHRPVLAGGVWLGPPWEPPPADVPAVVVDPGRAFGTGAHPTTRLCIEHLAQLQRGSLLDVGCGSGVVALAAAKLGFDPIVALDDDSVAIDCARENASRNGVALETICADVLTATLPSASVAVVNILLPVVERVLARLDTALAVTSGYAASDAPAAPGWRSLRRLELDGWAADALARHAPE
jgi:ribosomal protein L11 methyltransferase